MPKKGKGGDRPLTPDEEALWQEITQHDKPIVPRAKARAPQKKPALKKTSSKLVAPLAPIAFEKLPELTQSGYDGVDRNTRERFRKGEFPIDGSLDLHGKTRAEASVLVTDFIHRHYRRGSRCLLVITGKGTHKQEDSERSVLREMLPGWLSQEDIRPYVLAYDRAQIRHGGSGAFYILLRRQR